ncbi:MAG TPA: hypothetical protein VF389_06600, partial [Woeseiaceae bacterium]
RFARSNTLRDVRPHAVAQQYNRFIHLGAACKPLNRDRIVNDLVPAVAIGEMPEIIRRRLRPVTTMVVSDYRKPGFATGFRKTLVATQVFSQPMKDLHNGSRSSTAGRLPLAYNNAMTVRCSQRCKYIPGWHRQWSPSFPGQPLRQAAGSIARRSQAMNRRVE